MLDSQLSPMEKFIEGIVADRRAQDAPFFKPSNISKAILYEAEQIAERDEKPINRRFYAYYNGENNNTSSPVFINALSGAAAWTTNDISHRNNDQYSAISCGQYQWHQYGLIHRLNGPAIVLEEGMAWYAKDEDYPPYHHENPYYLFGENVSEKEFWEIKELHEVQAVSLELSFLVVVNGLKENSWRDVAHLPLSWQTKAFADEDQMRSLEKWAKNKKVYDSKDQARKDRAAAFYSPQSSGDI